MEALRSSHGNMDTLGPRDGQSAVAIEDCNQSDYSASHFTRAVPADRNAGSVVTSPAFCKLAHARCMPRPLGFNSLQGLWQCAPLQQTAGRRLPAEADVGFGLHHEQLVAECHPPTR